MGRAPHTCSGSATSCTPIAMAASTRQVCSRRPVSQKWRTSKRRRHQARSRARSGSGPARWPSPPPPPARTRDRSQDVGKGSGFAKAPSSTALQRHRVRPPGSIPPPPAWRMGEEDASVPKRVDRMCCACNRDAGDSFPSSLLDEDRRVPIWLKRRSDEPPKPPPPPPPPPPPLPPPPFVPPPPPPLPSRPSREVADSRRRALPGVEPLSPSLSSSSDELRPVRTRLSANLERRERRSEPGESSPLRR